MIGSQLFVYAYDDYNCGGEFCGKNGNYWAFRSLLNLTADLRALRSANAGGVLLSGTASDQNFDRYELHYALTESPDDWRLIQPAFGESVLDDDFVTWVPPGPGNYFVRLSVYDLAGNVRKKVKRVFWGESTAITDLFRSESIFSPNGDGEKDATEMSYRVLEPIHLEFNFYNADGEPVRTIIRDHTEVGEIFTFTWDGRDNNGLPLSDGEYRMVVQNYEFFFTLDHQAPDVSLVIDNPYQALIDERSGQQLANVAPKLTVTVEDENYSGSIIEWADINSPDQWYLHEELGSLALDEDPIEIPLALNGTEIGLRDEVSGRLYRAVAWDTAGNRTVQIVGPAAQELVLLAVSQKSLTEDGFEAFKRLPFSEFDNINGAEPAFFLGVFWRICGYLFAQKGHCPLSLV